MPRAKKGAPRRPFFFASSENPHPGPCHGHQRHLFAENPHVKWFKTIVALDRVKVGLEIPCG